MTDGPIPTNVDPQDPLPEANWLWRRVLTYALCVAVLLIMCGCGFAMFRIINTVTGKIDAMTAGAVVQITLAALATVEQMFRLMFWALIVVVTYYMVAPSAEQITKMLQTAGLLKAGVQIASRVVEGPERREAVATVGQPPQPVAPPVAAPDVATEAPDAATEGGTGTAAGQDAENPAVLAPPERETGSEGIEVAPDPGKPSSGLNPADLVKGV